MRMTRHITLPFLAITAALGGAPMKSDAIELHPAIAEVVAAPPRMAGIIHGSFDTQIIPLVDGFLVATNERHDQRIYTWNGIDDPVEYRIHNVPPPCGNRLCSELVDPDYANFLSFHNWPYRDSEGWVYFTADDVTHGNELWRSNGTDFERLTDLWTPGQNANHVSALGVVRDGIIFRGHDPDFDLKGYFGAAPRFPEQAVYLYDGSGVTEIMSLEPENTGVDMAGNSFGGGVFNTTFGQTDIGLWGVGNFRGGGDTIYFTARRDDYVEAISDKLSVYGLNNGLVTEIAELNPSNAIEGMDGYFSFGDSLIWTDYIASENRNVWFTASPDGSGGFSVERLGEDLFAGGLTAPYNFFELFGPNADHAAVWQDKFYFAASDPNSSSPDTTLWSWDGSTLLEVPNSTEDGMALRPHMLRGTSDWLVFTAYNQDVGREIWGYDGTEVQLLVDLLDEPYQGDRYDDSVRSTNFYANDIGIVFTLGIPARSEGVIPDFPHFGLALFADSAEPVPTGAAFSLLGLFAAYRLSQQRRAL